VAEGGSPLLRRSGSETEAPVGWWQLFTLAGPGPDVVPAGPPTGGARRHPAAAAGAAGGAPAHAARRRVGVVARLGGGAAAAGRCAHP
jgi:hypothetical protein